MKVKFSDVVRRANTKEDKDNTDKVFYVGGEHIDSNEVLITKRGIIAGSTIGPMFYFGFKAGQVLFVSRNPHLRKAGMVDFDGICSEKTFVLETIDENILLQRYLPFILQSDHFWSYAESNKSGSVNFFINWSTLAKYEFELPSIAKQKELSDLLWAINDTKLAYRKMLIATDELVKSQFIAQFDRMEFPTVPLSSITSLITKGTTPTTLGYDFQKSGVSFIKVENITSAGIIDQSQLMFISEECHQKLERSQLAEGDILFSIAGAIGRFAEVKANILPANTNQALAIIRLKKNIELSKPFLLAALASPYVERQYNHQKKGIAQINLTLKNIGDIRIPIPPMNQQLKFAAFVQQSDKSKFEIEQAITSIDKLYRSIIAENLG